MPILCAISSSGSVGKVKNKKYIIILYTRQGATLHAKTSMEETIYTGLHFRRYLCIFYKSLYDCANLQASALSCS